MNLKPLALAVLLATSIATVTAQQNPAKKKPAAKKELTREEIAKLGGFEPAPPELAMPPVIQVEFTVVSVPKKDALTLSAELKNPDTAEAAYRALTAMIKKKTAKLIACPSVETKSGNRCVIENVSEVRYAVEFERLDGKKAALDQKPDPIQVLPLQAPAAVGVTPTSFETRNAGVTLELEPILGPDDKTIDVQFAAHHVQLLGWDTVSVEEKGELVQRIPQPRFHTNKVSSNFTSQAGQRVLAGVFETAKDPDSTELFLIKLGFRDRKGK